jgi:hypothetical protein
VNRRIPAPPPDDHARYRRARRLSLLHAVLATVLAHRGVARVVATDADPRAVACAAENLERLGFGARTEVVLTDLFPPGPAGGGEPAVAAGPPAHAAGPRGVRPEHLGLRTRAELLSWIAAAGMRVVDRVSASPRHPRALDPADPLHRARAAEVTSLWRLSPQ